MAEIKNLKKAADRILKAVKNKERIILYGDADFDGISSVIILEESIKTLDGGVSAVYFPDREKEGYGLNKAALGYLKNRAKAALLILLDCGIGNVKEVDLAKKFGFEVIIIDHHRILEIIPKALIIVDPHQKGERYPFKKFATAGIVFRLAKILLKNKLTPALENNFLELTGLATVADMMAQTDDNKEFVQRGMQALKNTERPGLKVFESLVEHKNTGEYAQKIISACHAGGTNGHINEGYLLFTSSSINEARIWAGKLLNKAKVKQQKIKNIVAKIEKVAKRDEPIIFEGNKSWEVLMTGPVASIICRKHKKPVFLYSRRREKSQGAVRTPQGVDGVKAMINCSKLLEVYGGHPQAAGFRIKNKNLDKFKKCLIDYF